MHALRERRAVVMGIVLVVVLIGALVLRTAMSSSDDPSARPPAAEDPSDEGCGLTVYKDEAKTTPWTCSFAEDFNGQTLDPARWHLQTTAESGFGTREECFVDGPDNIGLRDGVLRLSVTQVAAPVTCALPQGGTFSTRYLSASVSTYKRWSQKYGRFEIRARFPSTARKGIQDAIWLWPDDPLKYGPWPASGEIDIAEMFSLHDDRAIPTIHYLTKSATTTNNFCVLTVDEWHTYSLEWTPTTLTVAYDGVPCLTHEIEPATGDAPAPFDQPFIVALTNGLGSGVNAIDPADPPVLPVTLQVDYVRVWS